MAQGHILASPKDQSVAQVDIKHSLRHLVGLILSDVAKIGHKLIEEDQAFGLEQSHGLLLKDLSTVDG